MEVLWVISTVAVNCYIMISGYFLIHKTEHRWNGILKVLTETIFYSLIIYIITTFVLHEEFRLTSFAQEIFIIYFQQYWFINFYIALMLLAPYISIMVKQMNKKQYQSLLLIMLILCFQLPYGKIFGGFASIPYFTLLYLTAGYIRIYSVPKFLKTNSLVLTFLFIICFVTLTFIYNIFIVKQPITELSLRSTEYNGPIYFLSILFFLIFIVKPTLKGWIPQIFIRVAPYTLGVYLIHDNHIIRTFLWDYIFDKGQITSHYIIFQCIIICATIFFTCILIDYLRYKLFTALHINNLLNNLSEHITNKCSK